MKVAKRLIYSLLIGLAVGAVVAALSPGVFWRGWLAAGFLSWLSAFFLWSVWSWAGAGKTLAWMVVLAFLLRLGVGMAVSLALPVYGHDEPTQKAGYLFFDAYKRDQESWGMVLSKSSFIDALYMEFDTDQYGGLLVLSGMVYSYLSPDAHRPFLVLILGAFTAALGVPFFWRAVRQRWNISLANLAGWILVSYPDGIFFGASQMREPFLIGLSCVAFWAVVEWAHKKREAILAFMLSTAGMAVFSSRVFLAVMAVLAVWFWLEYLLPCSKAWRIAGILGLIVAGLGLLFVIGDWLRSVAWYDLRLTVLDSGRWQEALNQIQGWMKPPVLIGYGLTQPVLPAAIAYPTVWIWKVIAILRAAGWYALAPFLLYAVYTSFKIQVPADRRVLLWSAIAVMIWIIVSSARAGGDQWDNPRYRTLFLPWMALLTAWAVQHALATRDLWLVRWLLVEAIFLAYFTHWYFTRYFQWSGRMPFWRMIAWILGLSALVLSSGWLWDAWRWWRKRRSQ
ncbi:MAG: hypothetical protein WHV66_03145 [Anaerolineales bacterium]